MKKMIISLIIILFIIMSCNINIVKGALVESFPADFNVSSSSENVDDKIIVTISTGDIVNEMFNQVTEMGAEITSGYGNAFITVKYTKSHFTDMQMTGLNGWTAGYDEEYDEYYLYTDQPVTADTDIAQIEFTPIEEVENKIEGIININADISADYGLEYEGENDYINLRDQTIISPTYTILPTVVEEPIPEVNTVEPENVVENDNRLEEPKDNTVVPDKELPQTGVDIAITVAIIGLIVVSIIGFIKYRKTKIK